jgi:hypothetical protein
MSLEVMRTRYGNRILRSAKPFSPVGQTVLNALVSIIDRRLRARHGIFEYCDCPSCIFRVQFAATKADIALSDGTLLHAGSRLINLHLWNEHVPPFPARGPTLGWARRMCHRLEVSLQELASFVASCPDLDDVAALGGKMIFGSIEQTQLVARAAQRYGFVCAVNPEPCHSVAQWLHLVGENLLISMIVISHNPAAFRADYLSRKRVPVYIRRGELMRRFGSREPSHPAHQPNRDGPIPISVAGERK